MIEHLEKVIEERLEDNKLTNREIAALLKMSERNFTRRVKELTGISANRYIRSYRLKRAMHFIEEGRYVTVNEISNAVGFSSSSYFSHKFEEYFNKKPLQVLKDKGWR
ncbi:MAG: helix-turn-helix transcriptional regulator [Bacteroidota bacterium]